MSDLTSFLFLCPSGHPGERNRYRAVEGKSCELCPACFNCDLQGKRGQSQVARFPKPDAAKKTASAPQRVAKQHSTMEKGVHTSPQLALSGLSHPVLSLRTNTSRNCFPMFQYRSSAILCGEFGEFLNQGGAKSQLRTAERMKACPGIVSTDRRARTSLRTVARQIIRFELSRIFFANRQVFRLLPTLIENISESKQKSCA